MIISSYHGTKVVWFMMDVDTWDKIPIRIPLCFFYFSDLIVEKEKSAAWCCCWPIMQLFIVLTSGRSKFKHHKGRYYA